MGIAAGMALLFSIRAAEHQLAALVLAVALTVISVVFLRDYTRKMAIAVLVGLLLGIGAVGLHTIRDAGTSSAAVPKTIVGTVVSDPRMTPRGVLFNLQPTAPEGLGRQVVLAPAVPIVARGETIQLFNVRASNEGDLLFVGAMGSVAPPGWLDARRNAARTWATRQMQRYVPGSPGTLGLGLLIGDDTALPRYERDIVVRVGLSHLTAVSGWNVMLVTSTVGLIALRLGLRSWPWTVAQLLGLVAFVWIVGYQPPVVRAAVMAVLALCALRLGRPAHSVSTLALAAGGMAALDPDIMGSLSFQLSIVSTLGIIVAGRITRNVDGWLGIGLTTVVPTMIIGTMTAPIIAAEFGRVSPVSVPANVVVAPFVPLASILAALVLLTAPLPIVPTLLGSATWFSTRLILVVASIADRVPGGSIQIPPLSDHARAMLYLLVFLGAFLLLPEGQLAVRRFVGWIDQAPARAALTASTAIVVLLSGALIV